LYDIALSTWIYAMLQDIPNTRLLDGTLIYVRASGTFLEIYEL